VSAASREVVARGLGAVRRSMLWWLLGIVVFNLVNVAFWPSLKDSDTLTALEQSSGDLLEAFGAAGIATPAGYLDGQVYALLLPLLLSGMAVAMVTALTAGDEDGGRLELLHALPVSRPVLWLGRLAAVVIAVVVVTATVTLVMVPSLPLFELDGVSISRVFWATVACGLLALFHASVGYALAGAGASRGMAAGGAIVVLVVGYMAAFVLPLADALRDARSLSPWYWAIGVQPVTDGVSAARLVVLLVTSAVLVAVGTWRLGRRDIRAA
jgi:ABC-2 type transport system permease protein